MLLSDFPNAHSLRFNMHVMFVLLQSVLTFATEIADEDAVNLADEDRKLYDDLADYLERAAFEADKVRKRIKRAQ